MIAGHGHGVARESSLALAIGAAAGLAERPRRLVPRIAPLIATLATSSIYLGLALIVLPTREAACPSWLSTCDRRPVRERSRSRRSGWRSAIVARVARSSTGCRSASTCRRSAAARPPAGPPASASTRVRILAYVASGICSGLAGIVLAGLTQSGDPTIGNVYLLNAIAAVVVGGTSLAGGVGTIAGSVLGAIALALVSSVLLVSGLSTNYQYIVTGLIVIGALLAHSLQSTLQSRVALRAARRERPAAGVAG